MSNTLKNFTTVCDMCSKNTFSNNIKCSICLASFHKKCCKMTKPYFNNFKPNDNWYCSNCTELFAFHSVDDDEFLVINDSIDLNLNLAQIYNTSRDFEFKPFNYSEFSSSDYQKDIDPENNFYNEINVNCKYYIENQLNHTITKKMVSPLFILIAEV